jgi:hypothetical protein
MYGFEIFKTNRQTYNYYDVLFSVEGEKIWFAWDKKK